MQTVRGEIMQQYKLWINSKPVDAVSGKTYKVVNPATEEEIANVPLGDNRDVNKAVAAARKAFPSWARKTQGERSKIAKLIAAAILNNATELAELEIIDHGTPRASADYMVLGAAQHFEWAASASEAMIGEALNLNPNNKILLQREPIGVNALITPWNAPLLMVATKLAPCITVGNTCVVKPPSIDSLSTLKLAEILSNLDVPPGVVNVITGSGSVVGEALASHPDVGLVAFTGSCQTGKRIMELASQTVKKVQLELGGKNPVVVLEDADIDTAVANSVMAQLVNSGQICVSPGRFYLHKNVYDEFVEKFIAKAKSFVVGDPSDSKTQMGPVASAEHRDRIESYVKKGIAEGANLGCGGSRPTEPPLNKGYYVMPTVLTGVKQNTTVAREEIFGPVACFMEPFSSENGVIELANDNAFGLSSFVWTKNIALGIRFADRLCAGTVVINRDPGLLPELPRGGFKESGFGKEGSKYGLEDFTQLKVVTIDFGS
jgi:acyl-CoA reductase-like NAD-dependent aldehyde dehydrogenase